jgi:hypothetical protein
VRQPQQQRSQQQHSQTTSVPAPVGGLNARDSQAEMPPTDAVTLVNFFPTPTSVDLRKGYINWVTGIDSHVESLMTYNSATTSKLFGAAGTKFYDFTSQGAVGAAVVTGLSNARWQHANFGTVAGQYLYCVNGVNDPQLYNGSTWQAVNAGSAPIAITGVTTNTFISINAYKSRLYFIPINSLSFWYLPVSQLGGAAAQFDLTPYFKLGGYLMTMATWTVDSSGGVQEYAVFITSQGEVAMYAGSDPSNASNWALQGVFRVGRPVGRRCTIKVGSDILVLSADGIFPLSKALLTDRSQTHDAISDKIVHLVSNDIQNYPSNFGWEMILYPIGNKLILNVPQSVNSIQYQYVQNTISEAWCVFNGWNANCFAMLGDDLYFGGNLQATANSSFVAKCDVGYSDNGAFINGEVKTAFNYFGAPGRIKSMKMIRPVINTAGTLVPAIGMDMDFADKPPPGTPTFTSAGGTLWNSSLWNTFGWGDVTNIKQTFQGAYGVGYTAALHMKVVNNFSALQWLSTDYVYEYGGVI